MKIPFYIVLQLILITFLTPSIAYAKSYKKEFQNKIISVSKLIKNPSWSEYDNYLDKLVK